MTSALAAAAYRACDRLDGTKAVDGVRRPHTWDYSSKTGLAWSEILIPAEAPEWMRDRQRLWSAVDARETRKDAQFARELLTTLPRELPLEAAVTALKDWVAENIVLQGMVADICVHAYGTALDPRQPEQAERLLLIIDPAWPIYDMPIIGMTPEKIPEGTHVLRYPNGMLRVYQPHAHVMLTMRSLVPDGFGNKNREWNSHKQLYAWRQGWEEAYNALLAAHGSSETVSSRAAWKREIDAAHVADDEAEVERLSQTFSPRTVDVGGGYYAALDERPPQNPNQYQEMTPMDFNKALSEQRVRTQRDLQDQADMHAATECELQGLLGQSQKAATDIKAQNELIAEQLGTAEAERDHARNKANQTALKVKVLGDLLTEAAQRQTVAQSDAEEHKQQIHDLAAEKAKLEARITGATTDLESVRRQAKTALQARQAEEAARAKAESELREQTILLDDVADYITGNHTFRPRIADDATAIGRLITHAESQGEKIRQAESAIRRLADGVSHMIQSAIPKLGGKLGNWLIRKWNHLVDAVRGDAPLMAPLLPSPLAAIPASDSTATTAKPPRSDHVKPAKEDVATPSAPTMPPVPAAPSHIKAASDPAPHWIPSASQAQEHPVQTNVSPGSTPNPISLPRTATKNEKDSLRQTLEAMDGQTVWATHTATQAAAEEAESKGDHDSGYHWALTEIEGFLGMRSPATVSTAVIAQQPPRIPPAARLPKVQSNGAIDPRAR